jgi:hypothetical protein
LNELHAEHFLVSEYKPQSRQRLNVVFIFPKLFISVLINHNN